MAMLKMVFSNQFSILHHSFFATIAFMEIVFILANMTALLENAQN